MSEVGGVISANMGTNDKDTVGKLQVERCVKIVDEEGNRCGVNIDGEICVKLNHKCLGYFGNQKATDELFDAEGFAHTGDIGRFDEDGFLYLVDRKKELLKYNSEQISPSEIEAHLIKSTYIKAVCVVGIPENGTEFPAAVVVRADGSNITEKDVLDLIAGSI